MSESESEGENEKDFEGLKYRSEFEKIVVLANLEKRGFRRIKDGMNWNFFWATVGTVSFIFNPDNQIRLNDYQIINHFPNHIELAWLCFCVLCFSAHSRCDLFADSEGFDGEEHQTVSQGVGARWQSARWIHGCAVSLVVGFIRMHWRCSVLHPRADFLPSTYRLPDEYPLFLEEYKRNPHSMWILKPWARSQVRECECVCVAFSFLVVICIPSFALVPPFPLSFSFNSRRSHSHFRCQLNIHSFMTGIWRVFAKTAVSASEMGNKTVPFSLHFFYLSFVCLFFFRPCFLMINPIHFISNPIQIVYESGMWKGWRRRTIIWWRDT